MMRQAFIKHVLMTMILTLFRHLHSPETITEAIDVIMSRLCCFARNINFPPFFFQANRIHRKIKHRFLPCYVVYLLNI